MHRKAWVSAGKMLLMVGLLGSASAVAAQSSDDQRKEPERKAGVESREAEKRRAMEKKAGVQPAPKKPTEEPVAAPAAAPTPAAPPSSPRPTSGKAAPRGPDFDTQVHPVLMAKCESCHKVGGRAGRSKLILSADVGASFDAVRAQVDPSNAAASPLLKRSTGEKHAKALTNPGAEYDLFFKWIEAGARRGNAAAKAASVEAQSKVAAAPQQASAPATAPVPVLVAIPEAPAAAVTAQAAAPDAAVQNGVFFIPAVHQALAQECASCHGADGMAASTSYNFDTVPLTHYASARRHVVPGDPDASRLVAKARGDAEHGGGAVWADGSPELQLLKNWIAGGALSQPSTTDGAVAIAQPAAAAGATAAEPQAAATPNEAPNPHAAMRGVGSDLRSIFGSGLPLFAGFRLNGRFDLNYERRDYRDQPFFKGGRNAIQVYHNFLFLSWQEKDSPLSFTAELITLQLWELAYRLSPKEWPFRLTAKAGKLLVPFGADPIYHHNYGGLGGFDQRMLPIIWAREGVQLSTYGRIGPVALNHDLYAVAGHALRAQDAVLNLQSDLTALDDTQIAIGSRLGASYGPASAYYSLYYNDLRFDRRLVLQAIDLQFWRLRGVPVLQHFTFAVGAMRADVTGGGAGSDYYHFASYFLVRYFPVDWLFIQYRQGIQTYENRRGVIQDDTRWTVADASAHNIGVVARYHGLSFGLYHFWNFERADEIDDDFTRVSAAYEF